MDPSLETALAELRQLRRDRQNGLITDRDYDRRVAVLLQGQNASALLALLQAEGGAPATVSPPAVVPGPAPVLWSPPAAPAEFLPVAPVSAPVPAPVVSAPVPVFKTPPAAPPPIPPASAVEDEAMAELGPPASSPLLNYVLIGGGLLLLALLVAYLLKGQRPSEHLTSASRTAADTTALVPEVGPQAPRIELPPVAAPETVRTFPRTAPPTPAAVDSAAPVVVPAAPPADTAVHNPVPHSASAPTSDAAAAAEQPVRDALASYYADLHAAPFDAGAHFAPSVERFLTLRNITPDAIANNLARNHFPEFQDYQASIAPGSLRVSSPVADGSRTATYIEVGRSFRTSLQQHQQTRTQVRVRLTSDFKIDYLRQEKLLENTMLP